MKHQQDNQRIFEKGVFRLDFFNVSWLSPSVTQNLCHAPFKKGIKNPPLRKGGQGGIKNAERGLTLIELMVASVVMLIILMGLFQMMDLNVKMSKVQKNLSAAQDSARVGLTMMGTPVRLAGNGDLSPVQVFRTATDLTATGWEGGPAPSPSDAVPLFAVRYQILDLPMQTPTSYSPGQRKYILSLPIGLCFATCGAAASNPLDGTAYSDVGKIVYVYNKTKNAGYFSFIQSGDLATQTVVLNKETSLGGWNGGDVFELDFGMTEATFAYVPSEHAIYRRLRGTNATDVMLSGWRKLVENINALPDIQYLMSDGTLVSAPTDAQKPTIRAIQIRVTGRTPEPIPTKRVTAAEASDMEHQQAGLKKGNYNWDTVQMTGTFYSLSTSPTNG